MAVVFLFVLLASVVNAQVTLAIGDSMSVAVNAWEITTFTKIEVHKGEAYLIQASGTWADGSFPATDANGFKPFKPYLYLGAILKPLPNYNYMMLGARIGKLRLPVGTQNMLRVRRAGQLELFPNDAGGFFENNKGTLAVTILRIE